MDAPNAEDRTQAHLYDPAEPGATKFMTNIDRRTCQRNVPMRVLGLGVSRTGTVSLRQALVELGFGGCYHYSTTIQENPKDRELWIEALQGKYEDGRKFTRSDWDQLLGHCQSITDTPCTIFWEELLDAYPEAKVILTVRDSADVWYASQMATIMPFFDEFIVRGEHPPSDDPDGDSLKMDKLILQHYDIFRTLWQDYQHGGKEGALLYEKYIAAVKSRVPVDNLLIFNVKEGWEPLSNFLQVPAPTRPFPKRNDRATFGKNVDNIRQSLAS